MRAHRKLPLSEPPALIVLCKIKHSNTANRLCNILCKYNYVIIPSTEHTKSDDERSPPARPSRAAYTAIEPWCARRKRTSSRN